jgi:peptidoglycan/LPS O-acetylase OafA/YrhL
VLKYLRRKTNSLAFIPEIDGLRFFAIITVVIFHINTALSDSLGFDWKAFYGIASPADVGWWISRLDLGVKVFFAISGFILAMPFLKHYLQGRKSVDLRSYFARRLLRLEPPFIITLLLFFVGQIIVLDVDLMDYVKHLLANLVYCHGFIYGYPSVINPVTWSLETEAQFYIFVPFFLASAFFFKKKWASFIYICLAFILGLYLRKFIFGNEIDQLKASLLVYLTHFMMGILFAWLFIARRDLFANKSFLFDILGFIVIFGMFKFYKPQIVIQNNLVFNICIFLFFIAVFKGRLLNWFFTREIIFTIGGMCYTIYLIHYGMFYFLAQKFAHHLNGMGYNAQLLVFALFSLVLLALVSIVFFIAIEKPCMDKDWPKKLKMYLLRK